MAMDYNNGFANTPRQHLRNLLDSVVVAARKDVFDYSGGHLNEANLYKPPEVANHKSWPSAKKASIQICPPSKLIPPTKNTANLDNMKDTMVNFSLGTHGCIPLPPLKTKNHKTLSKSQSKEDVQESPRSLQDSPISIPTKSRLSNGSEKYENSFEISDLTNDGVMIEELKLPEVMLMRNSINNKCLSRSLPFDDSKHHEFLSGHLEAVTKKDQFYKRKFFEDEVIGKKDAAERNVMMGLKAVHHLENKLKEEISELHDDTIGPNFHRLQVYSGIFEDLVDESPTFGVALRKIKREYDTYMASLLDEPTGLNTVLQEQVRQLSSHPSSNPGLLTLEQARLQMLEKQAENALEENERLRKELRDEMERPLEPEPESFPEPTLQPDRKPEMDIAETVECLKATILAKLDTLLALRETLRRKHVPSTVCTHLEQCIKETEVDIQRLMSSKNYFEANINEMEKDLQDDIENADTTEKDQRRVWKKVSAVKSGNKDGQDSDNEQDEASKWDWYIS